MNKKEQNQWHLDTLAIHAGQTPDPSTGAIMTPVYLTSTYVQESPGVHKGYEYSRTANPTRTALEHCLAALEHAEYGLAFASGCAAASTLMHLFESGDHIICGDDVYGGTYRLFQNVWTRHRMEYDFIDLANPAIVNNAIRSNTKAVWIETPTNPLLRLMDIGELARICHDKGLLLIVDNTFATPYLQLPLELGADIVVHSTTKYLGGHSDVVGGFVGTNRIDIFDRLKYLQNAVGAVPGPLDSFLVLRGLKTLHVRMERHCTNTLAIVDVLTNHEAVEKVYFPGLSSHPQHRLATKQMAGFGGIVTFVLRGKMAAADQFMRSIKVFACAESLGGVESLADHPAIMTHAAIPASKRAALGIDDGLIRLSVGIEHPDDLKQDVKQALDATI
ncbi:MAG: cystathionine gamma-synthase [Myxococcales bacterium]|nr:cystathionine gamma-synthase [Myxococcales bacterium]